MVALLTAKHRCAIISLTTVSLTDQLKACHFVIRSHSLRWVLSTQQTVGYVVSLNIIFIAHRNGKQDKEHTRLNTRASNAVGCECGSKTTCVNLPELYESVDDADRLRLLYRLDFLSALETFMSLSFSCLEWN